MWNLIRLLALMIGGLNIEENNCVWICLIKSFLIMDSFLLCEILQSQYYDSHYNSYKVREVHTMMLRLVDELYGCHPLRLYQTGQAMFVQLRNHVTIPATEI